MAALIGILLGLILFVGILFYTAISWGYVASIFYVWFILPIFPELPAISPMLFIGIMFFLISVFPKNQVHLKSEYTDSISAVSIMFLGPWISLFGGWVLKLFM